MISSVYRPVVGLFRSVESNRATPHLSPATKPDILAKPASQFSNSLLMDRKRYLENNLTDYTGGAVVPDAQFLHAVITTTLGGVLRSRHADPTVYVGSAGIAYMLWHLCTSSELDDGGSLAGQLVGNGVQYARSAVKAMAQYADEQYGVSLLCGQSGALVVAALMTSHAAKLKTQQGLIREAEQLTVECLNYVHSFRSLSDLAKSSFCSEDEFLYGRAGYLFGGLMLQSRLGMGAVPQDVLHSVADVMLKSGRELARRARRPVGPLLYMWPPGRHKEPYLGAAHGLAGILYVLLHFTSWLDQSAEVRANVAGGVAHVMALECDSDGTPGLHGYYPASQQESPPFEPLVHWCHGSSGAVFLFTKAYKVLGDEQYLAAAVRAGEVVWQRGILCKGAGLCHGVSGNAYALLALYKATGQDKWLHRALQFGSVMQTREFQVNSNTADHPFSLFEGTAGAACLYADLLSPKTSSFPMFELRT